MNIVVNLNKDHGDSSHDAVASVKKVFKVKKAGHAGTLDPIATGVLLVCLNEATKITGYLSDLDKEYIMTAKLGESTDTYDSEGKIIKTIPDFNVTQEEMEKVIKKFIGEIEQTPPMYSAIKVSGKPLYKLARKGIEVERRSRKVTINSIELLKFESPFFVLKVSCSKGTYIRSLCNDIGNALGNALSVGAHITELIRTRIGEFTIENSAKMNELPHKTESLSSMDTALKHLPEIRLEGDNFKRAKHGNPILLSLELRVQSLEKMKKLDTNLITQNSLLLPFVRLKDPDGKLFGIGKVLRDSIKIERLFRI